MQSSAVSMRNILAILLLCSPCTVQAMDFHVSNDGLDKNPGTREKPLRTLAHAAERAKAGDTVILRSGIYREVLTVRHSGTDSKPLTFMAAKGEKVIISGADLVRSWKPYKGSILEAKIPGTLDIGFNQVFLDGRMMNQARFPNETSADLHRPTFIKMNADDSRITSPLLTQPDGFWNGGFIVGLFGHRWTIQCAKIKDYKTGTLSLVGKSRPWYKGDGQGYVSGVLAALDAPKEWHIEHGRLYFWPPDGTDMASACVEIKRRTLCVDFNAQSHVTVKGIDIISGSVRMVGDSCVLEDCPVRFPSHFTYFTWGGMAADGAVDKGHNGILVQGNDNVVRRCTIKYSAGSGIVIKGARNLITRCEISDIDYSGTYSCPISVAKAAGRVTGGNRIWFNTIRRTGRDCIQLYGASAEDIRYNDISESGLICKDLGMIYVWGRNGKGTRIAHNWVHDNRGEGPNPGIYLDNYCRNFIVNHNVIWNCEAGVRVNAPAEGHRIYNNTLFRCSDIGTHTYSVWPPNGSMKAEWPRRVYQYENANNLFLGPNPGQQLQDVENRKFWPNPGADAVDSGRTIEGFTDGFNGSAPDLGAYELGGPYWIPGINGVAEQEAAADVNRTRR